MQICLFFLGCLGLAYSELDAQTNFEGPTGGRNLPLENLKSKTYAFLDSLGSESVDTDRLSGDLYSAASHPTYDSASLELTVSYQHQPYTQQSYRNFSIDLWHQWPSFYGTPYRFGVGLKMQCVPVPVPLALSEKPSAESIDYFLSLMPLGSARWLLSSSEFLGIYLGPKLDLKLQNILPPTAIHGIDNFNIGLEYGLFSLFRSEAVIFFPMIPKSVVRLLFSNPNLWIDKHRLCGYQISGQVSNLLINKLFKFSPTDPGLLKLFPHLKPLSVWFASRDSLLLSLHYSNTFSPGNVFFIYDPALQNNPQGSIPKPVASQILRGRIELNIKMFHLFSIGVRYQYSSRPEYPVLSREPDKCAGSHTIGVQFKPWFLSCVKRPVFEYLQLPSFQHTGPRSTSNLREGSLSQWPTIPLIEYATPFSE